MRYFIAVDSERKNFNYVTRSYFENLVSLNNIEYTLKKNEYSDEILFASSEDYFSFFSHSKTNKKTHILALVDSNDMRMVKKTNSFEVTPLALSSYKKATDLIVFFKEQKEFLEKFQFKNIRFLPILPTIYGYKLHLGKDKLLNSEKEAFRKYFRIDKKRKVIVSFGNYANKEESSRFESVARTNPEYTFIFFGINNRDFVKRKLFERMLYPTNIQYYDYLEEELYTSLLNSADLLLLTNSIIPYPNIIIDFMLNKIPVISLEPFLYSELLNDKFIIMPTNFEEFYNSIRSNELINKKNAAHKYITKCIDDFLKKKNNENIFID